MKYASSIRKNKYRLLAACMAFALFSCASKYQFLTSAVVPAAEGWVKVSSDHNNNYAIDLEVKNLAEPEKLTPPKVIYIVWMNSGGGAPQNIGRLTIEDGLFSGMLKGTLHTVTSVKPSGFFITAETVNTTNFTGSLVVLKTP